MLLSTYITALCTAAAVVMASPLKTVWHINPGQVVCETAAGRKHHDQNVLEQQLRLRASYKVANVECSADGGDDGGSGGGGQHWQPFGWYVAKLGPDEHFAIPCQRSGETPGDTRLSCCYGHAHSIDKTKEQGRLCKGYGIPWSQVHGGLHK